MRPIWFNQSRRSRSISAAGFFFRPNSKYAAKTAASPANRRVYKRNGIFDQAPGKFSRHSIRRENDSGKILGSYERVELSAISCQPSAVSHQLSDARKT